MVAETLMEKGYSVGKDPKFIPIVEHPLPPKACPMIATNREARSRLQTDVQQK